MVSSSTLSGRRRLSRPERRAQLLKLARELIGNEGTDAFTLGRLAERAGVTKPVVYDHFGDKAGVFAELYREFEAHQRRALATALESSAHDLPDVADLVAGAYIECCLAEGHELAGVVAALSGASALAQLRREAEDAYLSMCREALEPLAGPIDAAKLEAVVGAGDALARGALDERISPARARRTLARVIAAIATETDTPPQETSR